MDLFTYITSSIINSIYLDEIVQDKVIKIINSFSNSSSSGWDGVNPEIVKSTYQIYHYYMF